MKLATHGGIALDDVLEKYQDVNIFFRTKLTFGYRNFTLMNQSIQAKKRPQCTFQQDFWFQH